VKSVASKSTPAETGDDHTALPLATLLGIVFCMPSLTLYAGKQPALASVNHQYLVVAGILTFLGPIAVLLTRAGGALAGVERAFALVVAIAAPITLSVLINIDNYSVTPLLVVATRILALSLYVATVGLLLQQPDGELLLQRAFVVMALILTALFLFSALTAPSWFWGRFEPGRMHPNWWGEILAAVVFGAAFIRGPSVLRYVLWGFALVGLVLVQSRGSLLFSLAIIVVALVITESPRRLFALGLIGLFLLPIGLGADAILSERPLVQRLSDFITSDVLLLDDPYRGLGSGVTGRDSTWAFALETITANPVFGVGAAITNRLATAAGQSLVHNGHFLLVADLGLVFVAPIYVLLLGSIVLGFRKRFWREVTFITVFIFFFAMFSPRLINASVNPMLLWMLVAYTWLKMSPSGAIVVVDDPTAAPISSRRIGERWNRTATVSRR
jgi:hypothetical protein